MTELLIIQGMALLSAPALTGIEGIDRFLAERLIVNSFLIAHSGKLPW